MAVLLASGACGGGGNTPVPSPSPAALPTARLAVVAADGRAFPLVVELAATPEDRQRGLMFRHHLPEDAGMLFLFPSDTATSFWMKDTSIPLTIAFLAADGRILATLDGKPYDETPLSPGLTYRYALEVNQGWFARRGLDPLSARVELPTDLPPAR